MDNSLPPQRVINESLICLPTPCDDVTYYPASLADLGENGQISVFQLESFKSGNAYLAATLSEGINFRRSGAPAIINTLYLDMPWKEQEVINHNGIFRYKVAPSYAEFERLLGIN